MLSEYDKFERRYKGSKFDVNAMNIFPCRRKQLNCVFNKIQSNCNSSLRMSSVVARFVPR